MKIIKYSPELYEALRLAITPISPRAGLFNRSFVDYYYTSNSQCKLHLAVDDAGVVMGTLGLEQMPFASSSGALTLGFASNYYSFAPGVGALLFLKQLQDCALGLVYPGGEETHKVVKTLGWTYFPEIPRFHLNGSFTSYPDERVWRKAIKAILTATTSRSINSYATKYSAIADRDIQITPEQVFTADLLPRASPFAFRLSPGVEYLNWRYNTDLDFVRYRLFRITRKGSSIGYVVISDKPDCLLVAHCDGIDAQATAVGVLLAIAKVGAHDRRPVLLASSHPTMQQTYRQFGFRRTKSDWRFAAGGRRRGAPIDPDTSNWLVNYDWGDNGLCAPFWG